MFQALLNQCLQKISVVLVAITGATSPASTQCNSREDRLHVDLVRLPPYELQLRDKGGRAVG